MGNIMNFYLQRYTDKCKQTCIYMYEFVIIEIHLDIVEKGRHVHI